MPRMMLRWNVGKGSAPWSKRIDARKWCYGGGHPSRFRGCRVGQWEYRTLRSSLLAFPQGYIECYRPSCYVMPKCCSTRFRYDDQYFSWPRSVLGSGQLFQEHDAKRNWAGAARADERVLGRNSHRTLRLGALENGSWNSKKQNSSITFN